MEAQISKMATPSRTTIMKHPDGTTTKTIYIRTKAGQAEDLKQRLASGKTVALVKKLQNGTANNNLRSNRSNVTLIKQTVFKPTITNAGTAVSKTTANVDADAGNEDHGKKNVMKPKAVALKVTPSGVVTPHNSQLLDLVRNYEVQQLQQQQQQHRQQHQLQQRQQQQQQQQGEKQSIQHVQQLQQQPHTYQPPQNQQQATVLQKTITMIPVSPGPKYNETKITQKISSPQPQLQMSPRSVSGMTFTNSTSLINPSVLPKPTNCETNEDNYTFVSHENPTQTVKSVAYPPKSVSPNTNAFRSPAKINRQPTTRFNFPMSSLLSLNLKNTIVTQLPTNQQLIAVPPKIESPGRNKQVKVSPVLQTKTPPVASYFTITEKSNQIESWSEQDAPLSAVSLQNGLQRVLSMTPFSAFLDEDVRTEKNKKSNDCEATSEKTDIVRSHKIVDEQLAKISKKTERADTLSGAETDVQKGQNCGNSKNLREERKTLTTKELRAMPRHKETKKIAANTGNVKVKRNSHFIGTVMDDKDLKEDLNQSGSENENERLSCGGDSNAQEQGDNIRINESKDTNKTLENMDSFESKLLQNILERILPEEAITPKNKVQEKDHAATINAPEKNKHLLGRDYGKFLSLNEAARVTRTRLGRKAKKLSRSESVSPVSIDKTSKRLEK